MAPNSVDIHRLTRTVQRLMDADLVLPDEAGALVEEIEASARSPDEAVSERARENDEPLYLTLEALVRTDRLDASIGEKAQAIVRRILYGTGEPD